MIIWKVIKESGGDFWEELLYLLLFNLICVVGSLLVVLWPFVTFALFFTIYDISQGKGIKLNSFLAHGRRMWKQAYIWGGLNLGAAIILWTNLNFYASIEARWAAIMQVLFMAITIFWVILQLLVLPLYPRLAEPSFKLALRNGAILMGRYPLAAFLLLIVFILFSLVSALFPPFILLIGLALIAIIANRTVGAVVDRELKQKT